MLTFRVIEYGNTEYQQMVTLRDVVLRKPLGLSFTREYLEQESNDRLLGCFDENDVICACCILTPVDKEVMQLRQMAVAPDRQQSGIGRQLISFAEQEAMRGGYTQLMMHARKTAQGFYERLGYHVAGEEFMEVGIPHYEMSKRLKGL